MSALNDVHCHPVVALQVPVPLPLTPVLPPHAKVTETTIALLRVRIIIPMPDLIRAGIHVIHPALAKTLPRFVHHVRSTVKERYHSGLPLPAQKRGSKPDTSITILRAPCPPR